MSIKLAFAVSNENKFEAKHFGDADKYMIYNWQDNKLVLEEELINQAKDHDESEEHGSKKKGNNIISALNKKDVKVLVSKQFGKNIKMINKHFIPIIISHETIDDMVNILMKNMKWLEDDLQNEPGSYKLFDLRRGSLKLKIKE